MDAAERAQAFDLLSRAVPARVAGLRVGLPVVKRLVKQSGGAISVSSGEGQGTTVRVSLPHYELDDYLT
jgi:signal transduction histidine kinase